MYHYVRDLKNSRYPGIKGLPTDLFREQIHYLKKNYNIVRIEEVIAAYAGEFVLPDNPVLLTFDDAYSDHFSNAFPILKHERIQGCFYPPVKAVTEHMVLDVNKIHFILASTPEDKMPSLLDELRRKVDENREEYGLDSFDNYFEKLAVANRFDSKEVIFVKRLLQVALPEELRKKLATDLFEKSVGMEESVFSRELYMSLDQIKCMVDCGMHIGSHGYDHYWLGSLSKEQQEFEIQKSVEFINAIGGDVNNWSICYPYGNYNTDTLEIIKCYGCKLGLTTVVNKAEVVAGNGDSVYTLPRLDTNDLPKDRYALTDKWKDK